MTLSSAFDIAERVRAPRTAFLDFPLGNQVGPPGQAEVQRQILTASLELFETVRTPGEIVRLPFEWPDPGWRDDVRALYMADAEVVRRQRLEGEYVDGVNIAADECADVCSLI